MGAWRPQGQEKKLSQPLTLKKKKEHKVKKA
jgi:hypothetical protein